MDMNKNNLISIQRKFVVKSAIDNKSAFAQVVVLRQTGNKPLPEPMLTLLFDA